MKSLQVASIMMGLALAGGMRAGTSRFDGPQTGAVPKAVTIAEGLAEDIQADLEARNWTMAHTRLAELQKNRSALRIEVVPTSKISGYEVALDSLTAQVERQDQPAALQSANRMSRKIVGVMGGYDVTIPVQVGYLDVAGRDAIYGAESGRWQDASAAAAELHANYAIVRAHVAGKDSILDGRMRQQLNELDAAVAARGVARVRATATALLGDVDLIERTY